MGALRGTSGDAMMHDVAPWVGVPLAITVGLPFSSVEEAVIRAAATTAASAALWRFWGKPITRRIVAFMDEHHESVEAIKRIDRKLDSHLTISANDHDNLQRIDGRLGALERERWRGAAIPTEHPDIGQEPTS